MSSNQNILMGVPREIRDHIFSYMLISNTGMITYTCTRLGRTASGDLILLRDITTVNPPSHLGSNREELLGLKPAKEPLEYLSLLLTCKQISQECREMLCSRNAFFGWPSLNWIRRETSALRDIRHIIFDCEFAFGKFDTNYSKKLLQSQDLKTALSPCKAWSRVNTLQRITLFFSMSAEIDTRSHKQHILSAESFQLSRSIPIHYLYMGIDYRLESIDYCKSLLKHMESLKTFFSQSQSHVKLDLRVVRFDDPSRNLDLSHIKRNNAIGLMRELHEHIGADLWINERLCYKDGVEMIKPFQNEGVEENNSIVDWED
ncbi:hypothetical protein NHQ30_009996 [Ciborinia camelliae]|nr:hypothetical protein NHQ30_009996 [Ciborinia camelliae]